jgi:hypothetical protein
MPEKTPNDFGGVLEQFEASHDTLFEISQPLYQHTPNLVSFYMVPDLLVRVEFRRVRRQIKYPESPCGRSHISLNLRRPVDRVIVDDEIDRFLATPVGLTGVVCVRLLGRNRVLFDTFGSTFMNRAIRSPSQFPIQSS